MILLIPLFGFTLLWFVTAPDARYFGPLAWLFAIAPALAWISRREPDGSIACGSRVAQSPMTLDVKRQYRLCRVR